MKTLTEELQEKVESNFNRLCTTKIEDGGFARMNGTMDSYEQAMWLRKETADLVQTVLKRVEGEIDKTDFYDWNSQTQKMIKDRIKQEAIIRLQQSDK